jgi:ATP-binding cassette subfamily B protein/subfamily B ATP-binding cassette protein MsbA
MKIVPLKDVARVLRYLLPYRKFALASLALTLFSSLAALLTPWPLKIVVDNVLQRQPLPPRLVPIFGRVANDQLSLLLLAVVAGLLVVLAINTLHVLSNYVNTKVDQLVTLDFRGHLFLHAQRQSLAFHDRRRSGMLIYLINNQGDAPAALMMTIPMLAESALTLVGMFWISYRLDSTLALISLAVVPFLYYSVGYYATHIQGRIYRVRELEAEALAVIHEGMSMIRVITAFGREEHECRRYHEQTRAAISARIGVTVRQTVFSLAVNMITAVGSAIVLGLGGYHVIQGRLTVGNMLVLIAYIAAVYKPLETISYTIGSLQDRFVSIRNALDLLDTEPDIQDSPNAFPILSANGHVVYENVQFSYSGRSDTLKEISFEAKAGQIIGVVGPTGAGKTTLVSLLPRFYSPKEGRILLDGTDIRNLTLKSLRQQISIVLQDPLLFSGTIAENIRYGRLDASRNEIIEAARAANAHEFITRLPDGYDSQLGERGAQLSGGERQRISVARAFLKNAPILILDEPTSSVDSKTEAVILEALDRLMVGRTTFVIAHRLSTLGHADLILVLNEGRLVELGTQDELLRRGGLYRQLYDAQLAYARKEATTRT